MTFSLWKLGLQKMNLLITMIISCLFMVHEIYVFSYLVRMVKFLFMVLNISYHYTAHFQSGFNLKDS